MGAKELLPGPHRSALPGTIGNEHLGGSLVIQADIMPPPPSSTDNDSHFLANGNSKC